MSSWFGLLNLLWSVCNLCLRICCGKLFLKSVLSGCSVHLVLMNLDLSLLLVLLISVCLPAGLFVMGNCSLSEYLSVCLSVCYGKLFPNCVPACRIILLWETVPYLKLCLYVCLYSEGNCSLSGCLPAGIYYGKLFPICLSVCLSVLLLITVKLDGLMILAWPRNNRQSQY